MKQTLRSLALVGLALALAGCPFSTNELNTGHFACKVDVDCAPGQGCVPDGTSTKTGHCYTACSGADGGAACPAGQSCVIDDNDAGVAGHCFASADAGVPAECSNGVKDDAENYTDCGGPCKACDGEACTTGDDCAGGNCIDGTCACSDGSSNNGETGVDCGGSCTAKCENGSGCGGNQDCVSDYCSSATGQLQCAPPCSPDCNGKTCGNDGCGGECGSVCGTGKVCNNNACASCPSTIPPDCDGTFPGACFTSCPSTQFCPETGGGGCRELGQVADSCKENRECASGMCLDGHCS